MSKKLTDRQVGLNRLLLLATRLDTVPRKKFDMLQWIMQLDEKNYYLGAKALPTACHTAGCAMVWACTMPEFRKLGLRLWSEVDMSSGVNWPYLNGRDCDQAAALLFCLTEKETVHLFMPGQQFTPKREAKRIRAFVKANGVPKEEA